MDQPIRILCVFGRTDRGGAETMCMNLYRHMDRDKVQFDFVKHTEDRCDFDDEIEALGGRIFSAPRLTPKNYFTYKRWWREHLKKHPEHRIIHGHMFTISSVYFGIAHEFGCVTLGHSHSTPPNKNEYSILVGWMRRIIREQAERRSDYCLACSASAGKFLFPNKEFQVLRNAIDIESYACDPSVRARLRTEFSIADTKRVVCVVGSFSPVKNPMGTLAIFRALRDRNPNTRLLWCGDGGMRPEIERRISELGLGNAVILAGVRGDIPAVLQAADVYIMPSLVEGLPVAAVEAQAAGLPCVLSDAISREAAITDMCTFVPLDDTDAWVAAIEAGFACGRSDTTQTVRDAGYDIKETSKWLRDFYLRIEAQK